MITLITLAFSHVTLKLFGFSQKISNLVTCTMFQLYFLLNCQNLMFHELYSGKSDLESTVYNIMMLKDYFIYDTLYLVTYRNDIVFMVHHILSLTLITFGYLQEVHSTFMYNLICYVLESTSPLINLRSIIKHYKMDKLYLDLIGDMILFTYLVNRIIFFPLLIIYIGFVYRIEYFFVFSVCFSIIYGASLLWFIEMLDKF